MSGVISRTPAAGREHLSGYQARDYDIVDYRMYELPGTGLWFRGPMPDLEAGRYFTCIGAAQTFGCFCSQPFPDLLAQKLGLPSLNLGYGGAGPEFFARQPGLLDYVNRGRFLILQVMSGRSQSNALFDSGGLEYLVRRRDGTPRGANQAYQELLEGPRALRSFGRVGRVLARMVATPRARRVAEETRQAWIESHRKLLEQVRVPVVLLWFSKRVPAYTLHTRNLRGYFADFPQLIDEPTLAAVKPLCDAYVACVSSRGMPQPLVSRFTGQPTSIDPARDRPDLAGSARWTHNHYYPSPEMHEDAAAALLAACRRLVQATPDAIA